MIDYLIGECCTQGFPTLSAINSLAASCNSQSNRCLRDRGRGDSGSTYIIPDMRFTCDGTIVRWSAGGVYDSGHMTGDPGLQIWRPTPADSTDYTVVASISLYYCNGVTPPPMMMNNVYDCQLSTGVSVQDGDILGVSLTRVNNNSPQFRVFFDDSNTDPPSVLNYYYTGELSQFSLSSPGGSTEQALPLIALNVTPNGNLKKSLVPLYV